MARKGALQQIGERSGSFATAFVAVFALTFFFLASVGATPNPIHPKVTHEPVVNNGTPVVTPPANPETPIRIIARDIGMDAAILNPVSTDVEVLDKALLSGAVRYPGSAPLGVDGTVLLFGHSSYLPVVHNQAYKAFNGIQKLKAGQIIDVYSAGMNYKYAVVGVKIANATQDSIELNPNGKHLTLVTCDSFATKSSRFVVTADFVGAYEITSQ